MRKRPALAVLPLVLALAQSVAAAPPTLVAPSSLAATAMSSGQVNLSWVDPNSSETGHAIERSLSSASGFVQVATVGKNVTTYQDTGLASNTTHYYRVRATGPGKSKSAYSNTASATTMAGDSTAPTVSISSPPSGTTYTSAQTVTITATASDNVGVVRVEFYDGATLRCTDTTAPYACAWTLAATDNGVHGWTARAHDAAGNTTTSTAVSLTVSIAANQPPVANAGPDQAAQTLTTVSFSGSGSFDPDGTVTSYAWTFGDGGSASGVSVTHAYATAGTYTVTLTVGDNAGAQGSDTAVVTVTAAPSGGAHLWSQNFGGGATDHVFPEALAVDAAGNLLLAGSFQGTVNLGTGPLASAGGADLFLAKFAPAGTPLWTTRLGGASDDVALALAVDRAGDLLVTGYFSGTVDFGGGPLTSAGLNDLFVAKFAGTDGRHLWSRRAGSATGADRGYGLAVDASDNVLVTGYFTGTADFGTGPLASAGGADVFLAKYAPAGTPLWAKRLGGTSSDVAVALAVGPGGTVALTGYFQGTADFGTGPLASAGANDVFVALYSADGLPLWARRAGSPTEDRGASLAVDAAGNVVVTGTFTGTVDFGTGPLTNSGGADIFLAQYSAAGAPLWTKAFGTSLSFGDAVHALALDPAGNLLLTGAILGDVDFGGGPLWGNGSYDVFLVKLSPSGAHLWSRRAGALYDDHGTALAADPSANVLATGYFAVSVDFGGGPLQSPGGTDLFLLKLGP